MQMLQKPLTAMMLAMLNVSSQNEHANQTKGYAKGITGRQI